MSKPCEFCGGKRMVTVTSNTVHIVSAQIVTLHFSLPCPNCNGKGVVLTDPVEIVEEFLGNMKKVK